MPTERCLPYHRQVKPVDAVIARAARGFIEFIVFFAGHFGRRFLLAWISIPHDPPGICWRFSGLFGLGLGLVLSVGNDIPCGADRWLILRRYISCPA